MDMIMLCGSCLIIATKVYSQVLRWELGLAFCSTQLSTQVPCLTFGKMLPCARHPCHTPKLRTPCEVVSPNFQALYRLNCMDWPKMTWELFLYYFKIEGWQANAIAHEAVDHLTSFCQVERRFRTEPGNWTTNRFLKIWVSLYHHPIVRVVSDH